MYHNFMASSNIPWLTLPPFYCPSLYCRPKCDNYPHHQWHKCSESWTGLPVNSEKALKWLCSYVLWLHIFSFATKVFNAVCTYLRNPCFVSSSVFFVISNVCCKGDFLPGKFFLCWWFHWWFPIGSDISIKRPLSTKVADSSAPPPSSGIL